MTEHADFHGLLSALPLIAPSMLKCDFANLQREVALLESAGARLLHLDVMDGHFVPNLSYGPVVISSLRDVTSLPFEAHLMISEPGRYIDSYLEAGCNLVTFHIEAVPEPTPLLRRIRQGGAAAGLALNPGTPVRAVQPFIAECDLILAMSVEPGFGGQKFMPVALEKLRELAPLMGNERLLSVDGGIDLETIPQAARAGARQFVVGSAIFEAVDYREAMNNLLQVANGAAVSANSE